MLIYLPPPELIEELHEGILEISKGKPGIRDFDIIKAAVHRPKTYLAYHHNCDIHIVCAVILDSIARNHGFIDGNKRTGLLSALLTYELNGLKLDRRADRDGEFEDLVLWVVTKKPDILDIAEKLKSLTEKYRTKGISKYIQSLRNLLNPYDSDK
jgi:death on curing protein